MKICRTCQQSYSDDVEFCPRDGARLTAPAMPIEAQLAAGLARRFRVIRQLGKGGMGTVFLAEQIGVGNRPVALKVLNRKFLDDPDFLLRFENEAGSTGRIHHANVVSIYESAQVDDGTPYIAMEYLVGESLREVLKRRGALPLPEVVEILKQVARGVNAAHKLGIIHRDLKPDNIFLTRGDEGELVVKVVDFGIAKLRESAVMHTQTGIVLGTPAYMSSEQAYGMRSDELDARSDVYSLGVVVYEMLTGVLPFHSDTPAGFLRKHMLEEPPPFRGTAQGLGVSSEVEAVVMKALMKKREERIPSVLEFSRVFAAATLSVPSPQASRELQPPRVVPSPSGGDRDASMPLPSTILLEAATAIQTSSPGSIGTPRIAPPQGGEPSAEVIRRRGRSKSLELQRTPEPPGIRRFIAFAGAVLILMVVGVWHFWPWLGPKVRNPQSGVGMGQTGTGQQGAALKTSVPKPPMPAAGTVKENVKDGLKYVWIPPGNFQMGCSPGDGDCGAEEMPPHPVSITKGFWMGQTEVTVRAYRKFAGSTGVQMPAAPEFNAGWNNQEMPVVNVTWNDATAFCGWAGSRLPTEAEWEYAARSGSTRERYGPIDEVAWYSNNSGQQTHPAAEKRPNAWNLYDLLGSVWEWVNDGYEQNYYQDSPSQDPSGPAGVQERVLRGGAWFTIPRYVRVSARVGSAPTFKFDSYGFRCGGALFNL